MGAGREEKLAKESPERCSGQLVFVREVVVSAALGAGCVYSLQR